jgi:6-pyruvoyltetrahydropterin/6-carboxytetrahydropterin synthase
MVSHFCMYRVEVHHEFKARHAIVLNDGTKEPLHGHTFFVEAVMESCELNEKGCVIDFLLVKKYLQEVTTPLEGKDLNDLSFFTALMPTAELLAHTIYDQLYPLIAEHGVALYSVKVWEEEGCSATYIAS